MNGLTIALLALSGCLLASACEFGCSGQFYGQEVLGSACPSINDRLAAEDPLFRGPLGYSSNSGCQRPFAVGSGFSPVEVVETNRPSFEINVPSCEYNNGPLGYSLNSGCQRPFSVGSGYSPVEVLETSRRFPSIEYNNVPQIIEQPNYIQNGRSYLEGSIDCGPSPRLAPIRYLPEVVLPVREEQIRVLPAPPLPAPVVVANKCICKKVVEKPQLFQRLIVSQKNERFLKRTYVPRTEKVEYSAKPRC